MQVNSGTSLSNAIAKSLSIKGFSIFQNTGLLFSMVTDLSDRRDECVEVFTKALVTGSSSAVLLPLSSLSGLSKKEDILYATQSLSHAISAACSISRDLADRCADEVGEGIAEYLGVAPLKERPVEVLEQSQAQADSPTPSTAQSHKEPVLASPVFEQSRPIKEEISTQNASVSSSNDNQGSRNSVFGSNEKSAGKSSIRPKIILVFSLTFAALLVVVSFALTSFLNHQEMVAAGYSPSDGLVTVSGQYEMTVPKNAYKFDHSFSGYSESFSFSADWSYIARDNTSAFSNYFVMPASDGHSKYIEIKCPNLDLSTKDKKQACCRQLVNAFVVAANDAESAFIQGDIVNDSFGIADTTGSYVKVRFNDTGRDGLLFAALHEVGSSSYYASDVALVMFDWPSNNNDGLNQALSSLKTITWSR